MKGVCHAIQYTALEMSANQGGFMAHPQNKRDRFLVSVGKSKKRTVNFVSRKDVERITKIIPYYRDITKKCSSPACCGNPRRRGELTRQEVKFNEAVSLDF